MSKEIFGNTLFRFIIVGIINTLTGMAIMFGLYNLAGASYWISSAANYVLVSILSFVLNKKFTFRHEGEVAASGVRFAINIGVCYFIAYGVAKPCAVSLLEGCNTTVQENVAMLLGMCIFTVINYLGQRLFVFKKQHK